MRQLWVALLLVGCGGELSPTTDHGDAGVDGSNDAGVDSTAAVTAACAARAMEVCRGFATCRDPFPQIWYADKDACVAGEQRICERDIGVPGVVDPLAQVQACTKELAARPACPRGPVPLFCAAARPHGSLPDGTSCTYDEQCDGGICAGFTPGYVMAFPICGHCARTPQLGDPCSYDKNACSLMSTTLRNRQDFTCDFASGKCIARLTVGASCSSDDACEATARCTDGKCVAATGVGLTKILPPNAECGVDINAWCGGGQFCKRATSGPGTCTDPYAVGERCHGPSECGHVNRCTTVPGEGLSRCTDARPSCAG